MVEAFLFKLRSWYFLHVDGFQEATFDKTFFDRLVLKNETKEHIQRLTQMYTRSASQPTLTSNKIFHQDQFGPQDCPAEESGDHVDR
ncbi:hypothetical protein QQZ08_008683 [Neonectria magnoliae]|uniref:Uncharacterized protein n=1 Tax=Neonectria magnoliae TaxID=2732573 RepID=A0ABR1HSJ9_9HYPO